MILQVSELDTLHGVLVIQPVDTEHNIEPMSVEIHIARAVTTIRVQEPDTHMVLVVPLVDTEHKKEQMLVEM